jgi:hypothetical protein
MLATHWQTAYSRYRERNRSEGKDAPACNTHAIESYLETMVATRQREDQQGADALAAVAAICNGKQLSSCNKVTLRKLGDGWSSEWPCSLLCYLVSPTGKRVHIPNGILDAEAIHASNTCWTDGKSERDRKCDQTRARIPDIAAAIVEAVEAQAKLGKLLNGDSLAGAVAHIEYQPWYLIDAMLERMA